MKPTGYYILVEVEEVHQEVQEGALKGFQMTSNNENEREQEGHDVGVVLAFGPTAFTGFKGIDDKWDRDRRAEEWGVKVGDKVEFQRYDGKKPRHPDYQNCRLIQDQHIQGVYS